jgi:putative DNA primase/helicase
MRRSVDSRFLNLKTLRAALGGEITGDQLLCPGPNHSLRDRSLAVRPTASGGFLVHSFAGDDWRICRDHVCERLGLPAWRPGCKPNITVSWTEPSPAAESERWRTERAQAIWAEGEHPQGTLAEEYLGARKLQLPAELCGSVLRYHSACLWGNERIPCLIAPFRSVDNNSVTGIHRIRLDRPERWPATERMMFGAVAGSAIKLDPPGQRLNIGEGLETCLAARQLGFGATWALGSARGFAPVNRVSELVVLGEHDEASRKAADACSLSWIACGRQVHLALPTIGKDFNDYLLSARQ